VTLTLAEANSIVDAAIAKARQLNVNVSVAVCDEQGHLIAFNRMDGTYIRAPQKKIPDTPARRIDKGAINTGA
jgi:uncharacterized protein GlcG (DUF336 family)